MGQDGGEGLAEESISDLILPGKAEGGSGSDGRAEAGNTTLGIECQLHKLRCTWRGVGVGELARAKL